MVEDVALVVEWLVDCGRKQGKCISESVKMSLGLEALSYRFKEIMDRLGHFPLEHWCQRMTVNRHITL